MTDMSPEMLQILSARQALRVLDAAIIKTETRLRYLPSLIAPPAAGGGGTGAPGVSPMPGRRMGPLTQAKNGIPFKMTTNGFALNKAFFGKMGIPIAAYAAPAIAGAAMSHAAGTIESLKEMQKSGASKGEILGQAGIGLFDKANWSGRTFLKGVNDMMRAVGIPGARTDEGFDEDFIVGNRVGFKARQRDKMRAQAIAKVGTDLRKQYREAYEFIDGWTPEDFDVASDTDRKDLGIEMRRINQGRLEAWMDDQHNSRTRKAVRDASGD